MFLEYIHGTTVEELSRAIGSESTFGTATQHKRLLDQMAKIQAEVATFTFNKIGSLYYSEETSRFSIGPDLETGRGPWDSASHYYQDLADVRLKRALKRLRNKPSFALPLLLSHLLSHRGAEPAGPFTLVNRDFGAHNILVDEDFNIVGIVDFDGVMALPIEAAAQYPVLSDLDIDPPSFPKSEDRPLAMERIERVMPFIQHYKQCLIRHEADMKNGSSPVSDLLESAAAFAYKGMIEYATPGSPIDTWHSWALDRLREYAVADEPSRSSIA